MADGLRKGLTSVMATPGFSLFLRKAFIKAMGYSDDALNRPIVGITNTYSDYNPCHGNVPADHRSGEARRDAVGRDADGVSDPSRSRRAFRTPTSMYLRNLMAMDTEEMIRAQPMDSVVVIGGCDKTLPAQIMAAVSADLPTVVIPVGPMVVGHHKGEVLGACTDCRRLWGQIPRRRDRRGRDRGRSTARLAPSVGTLHGDGHRLHHGLHHRGAGPVAADERHDSRARMPNGFRSAEASGRVAAAMAKAEGTEAQRIADAVRVQERASGAAGDWRIDQRPHSSHGDRQPHPRTASTSKLSTDSAARCRC